MRVRALIVPLAIGLVCGLCANPRLAADDSADAIGRLVTRLGSVKFAEREAATRALEAIGAPALEALRKSAASPDLEIKRRAATLVKKIETRVETEQLLAPTRLRLKCEDLRLDAALTELAQKSGHTIVLRGPKTKYADRRVTVDTGDTTFWPALDALCRAAGLSEISPGPTAEAVLVAQEIAAAQARRFPRIGAVPGVMPGMPVPLLPPVPMSNVPFGFAGGTTGQEPVQTFSPAAAPGRGSAITLQDGKPPDVATHYAGALRIRALNRTKTISGAKDKVALSLSLDVGAEPTLQSLNVLDVRLEKAVDEAGQSFTQLTHDLPATYVAANDFAIVSRQVGGSTGPVNREEHLLYLRSPDHAGQMLRELKGTLVASVRKAPEPLITVDDVAQAKGKTVKGVAGGAITIVDVMARGHFEVRLELELPADSDANPMIAAGMNPGLQVNAVALAQQQKLILMQQVQQARMGRVGLISGNDPRVFGDLTLVDEKGKNVRANLRSRVRVANNVVIREYTLTCYPGTPAGQPYKLVYNASRAHMIEVPFVLHDIKLR